MAEEVSNVQCCTREAELSVLHQLSPKYSFVERDNPFVGALSYAADFASDDSLVIRHLILNRTEKLDEVVFLVKKGCILRFVLGPSLSDLNVRLFISHQSVFVEEKQVKYELTWRKQHSHEFSSCADDVQIFADLYVTLAGSFCFYFTVDGKSPPEDVDANGYFVVPPELQVGSPVVNIPLHGIVCQTVLSKNLGPFSQWLERLVVAKKTGYNAIHFTPLQELGDSQSAYALRDFFRLNPSFGSNVKFTHITELVRFLDKEWGMLSFTDLVLNHAANESEWIAEEPQCVYNLVNTPHLKPAFLLDCLLARFSKEVADGLWTDFGLPPEVQNESHLHAVQHILQERIEKLRLWEFYQMPLLRYQLACDMLDFVKVDIEWTLINIVELVTGDDNSDSNQATDHLTIQPDPKYRRLSATVDLELAMNMVRVAGAENLQLMLEKLNFDAECSTRHHLSVAISNVIHNVWQRFISAGGERAAAVTCSQPLVNRYFRLPVNYCGASVRDDEALMDRPEAEYCWAHSGWVSDDSIDPLVNFAEPPSNVYLRRELNSWTDSVKLRYGTSPADCPTLWTLAAKYASRTARVFHGVRLDNCHSTPLSVAEHVLRAARRVRPDLYVFAELYAGGEAAACRIANRLALSATIEIALQAYSPWKLAERASAAGLVPLGGFIPRKTDWLVGRRRTQTILFDQTHDDASPLESRTYMDPLPSAAVVSAVPAAIGSSRGYDELVPHAISVITETRLYRKWQLNTNDRTVSTDCTLSDGVDESVTRTTDDEWSTVNYNTGLIGVKRLLNDLHVKLAVDGYDEVAGQMLDDDIIVVTRRCRTTQRSVVTVAHTAFHQRRTAAPACEEDSVTAIKSFEVPGVVDEICLEASVVSTASSSYRDHAELIVGLSDYKVETSSNLSVSDSRVVRLVRPDDDSVYDSVELVNFPPGSVVVLGVSLLSDAVSVLDALLHIFTRWIWNRSDLCVTTLEHIKTVVTDQLVNSGVDAGLEEDSDVEDATDPSSTTTSSATALFLRLVTVVLNLSLDESRHVLFEAESERRASGNKFPVYHVPGYGDLAHCGLAGVAMLLVEMKRQHVDPVKHPLAANLRHGNWLMDYTVDRLAQLSSTVQKLSSWLRRVFDLVKSLPRCLVLSYFEAIVSAVYALVTVNISSR